MADPLRKPEDEPVAEQEMNIIGKPFRRVDGRAKVTGATKFADDLTFPRMCHVKLVRSHVPHALIVSIDVSEAAKVPGFLGFLTGKETPIPFGILPVSQDEHALCPDKVRFVGDPVVARGPPPPGRPTTTFCRSGWKEPRSWSSTPTAASR